MTDTGYASSTATVELFQRYVIPNYVRYPINLVRGVGNQVWDSEGNQYLDLFPGWGCNLLGHCPPAVVAAVMLTSAARCAAGGFRSTTRVVALTTFPASYVVSHPATGGAAIIASVLDYDPASGRTSTGCPS